MSSLTEIPTLINWLLSVVGVLCASLIALLLWFAMRVINQLDHLEQLVTNDIHRHDLRITALETWRDGIKHYIYKPGPDKQE